MHKHKLSLFALAISFGCGLIVNLPARAVDEVVNSEIVVSGDEDPTPSNDTVYYGESEAVTTSETDESHPVDEACTDETSAECQTTNPEVTENEAELENALDEGLADEPEVICATGDEEGCEKEVDPEMWPLYLSLGALAVTVIVVIIINLIGRKKQ